MKTLRPQKRSLSPFGTVTAPIHDPLATFEEEFHRGFPAPEKPVKSLKTIDDLGSVPSVIRKIWAAPANDAPELENLCRYLVRFDSVLQEKNLSEVVRNTMQGLFDQKTALFLVDHHNKESCEKLGWADEYRDLVLFSRERNTLVGCYFAPIAENQPALFSEFISRWTTAEDADRLLHFLDFSRGSKAPTFEFYLLFSHPALSRIMRDKNQFRALFDKAASALKRLSSPTWEKDSRSTLL